MGYPDYLEHHGILGQKWGVRRYQNEDGTYTKEGLNRRKNGVPKGYGISRYLDKNGNVTKEGKAHYETKPSHIMSANTLDRTKQGAKIGAGLSAGVSAAVNLSLIGAGIAAGAPAAAIGASFCTAALSTGLSGVSGAINGLQYGFLVGAIETHQGREYIKARERR